MIAFIDVRIFFSKGLFQLFNIRRKLGLDKKGPLFLFVAEEFSTYLEDMKKISESLISDCILVPNQDLVS